MNVSLINKDTTRGILKVDIVKADYAEPVEKGLRTYRQKANMPGFRKGMVPMSLVKKMYGKHVMAEEVNKLISDGLMKYIHDNKLHILGEPLPNETEQKAIDFDTQEEFEFLFDVALSPEINVQLSKKDKAVLYRVAVTDEQVNKQVEDYLTNYGTYGEVDTVEEKDLVKGTMAELENGLLKEGGLVVEEAVLMPMYFKDETEKAKFINAAKDSIVVFNPNKAYEGAEAELASLLKIDKSEVAGATSDFSFEIKEITRYKEAEAGTELFDKVLGAGVVKTKEEFTDKIRLNMESQFSPSVNFRFLTDIRNLLEEKAGHLTFAEDILKRWLLGVNEKTTEKEIETDFPLMIKDVTYHIIRDHLIAQAGITLSDEEIENFAKRLAKINFAGYGMLAVGDDMLANYARNMLKNEKTVRQVIDQAMDEKLVAWMKEQVTLDVKEVSVEEFDKLFQE